MKNTCTVICYRGFRASLPVKILPPKCQIKSENNFHKLTLILSQKMEDKLEEVLREFKSLRDRVILQDRRIARLEEQVAKVAM